MAYMQRRRKHTTGSPELAYLLVVLAAGVVTAWWASHRVGLDLSVISTAAAVLGITEGGPTIAPQSVGYSPVADVQSNATTSGAAHCAAGQAPTFGQGFAQV